MTWHFLIGFVAGAGLFLAMWLLSEKSTRDYMELKAAPNNRTPLKINGGFYYIVPEREYVELILRPIRVRGASPFEERRFKPRTDHDFAPWGERIKPGS